MWRGALLRSKSDLKQNCRGLGLRVRVFRVQGLGVWGVRLGL